MLMLMLMLRRFTLTILMLMSMLMLMLMSQCEPALNVCQCYLFSICNYIAYYEMSLGINVAFGDLKSEIVDEQYCNTRFFVGAAAE